MQIRNLAGQGSAISFWRSLLAETDLADQVPLAFWPDDAEARADFLLSRAQSHSQPAPFLLGVLGAGGEPDALALYRPSPWDSDYFGVAAGFLDFLWCRRGEDCPSFSRALCRELGRLGQEFITIKLPAHGWPQAQALEEAGARLVDSEITLARDAAEPLPVSGEGPWKIRQADSRDRSALQGLDIDFSHGRFFNDPRIGRDAARGLWRQALLNSLDGLARWVLLAEVDRRPAGVITIQKSEAHPGAGPLANLFMVGTEPRWQGTGLMSGLMAEALRVAAKECPRVVVEASLANTRALNFYLKAGFNGVLYGKTVLHLWLKKA